MLEKDEKVILVSSTQPGEGKSFVAGNLAASLALLGEKTVIVGMDILPGGTVPPNPTELVARNVLDHAIAQLKEPYDYVILDTAPIGVVTDTAIVSRVADFCLYVCRAEVTPKVAYQYINELKAEKKFAKLATVINDIDMTKRENSYGYSYGFQKNNQA